MTHGSLVCGGAAAARVGFRRQTGDLGRSARFVAAAGDQPRKVTVELRSRKRVKTMGLTCASSYAERRIDGGLSAPIGIGAFVQGRP